MPNRALRTAASGMYAQQLNIEVIANNIANVNTNGYKKNKPEFQDLMYQQVSANPLSTTEPGIIDVSNKNIQVGIGVKPSSNIKLFQQGDLLETNNQFDLSIQGEGFFQLRKGDGTIMYTRDGSFKLNGNGQLVSAGGYLVEPDISLNEDTLGFTVSRSGSIESQETDGDSFVVGDIELARFINPAGLKAIGDNLFVETEASGQPIIGTPGETGFGEVHQGYIESSNVDIVEEMIAMITAQRAYEINSKTVKTVEEMMAMANNLKRG
ncbi:flagellar basal-body rod protein FlgG [bacterium BMS3Abin03]|nr:flagellar basal-body rod protein FlgG [bacterium BMS3Abin03]HDZ58903.1 flagellar basal-body rod protein FlgG [Ignavibacteriales bacterium]